MLVKYWFKLPLYTQIAIGAIIGVILGFILGENAKYIAPIGDAFLQFLKMLIIPLVITTILSGILKMNDIKSFGKVGGGFLFYLLITSLLATAIGFIVALIIQPGKGNTSFLDHGEAVETEEFSFLDHFLNMIPANIFESLTNMDMLSIIIFTIIVGLIILSIGKEKSGTVIKFIEESANIWFIFTNHILRINTKFRCSRRSRRWYHLLYDFT